MNAARFHVHGLPYPRSSALASVQAGCCEWRLPCFIPSLADRIPLGMSLPCEGWTQDRLSSKQATCALEDSLSKKGFRPAIRECLGILYIIRVIKAVPTGPIWNCYRYCGSSSCIQLSIDHKIPDMKLATTSASRSYDTNELSFRCYSSHHLTLDQHGDRRYLCTSAVPER